MPEELLRKINRTSRNKLVQHSVFFIAKNDWHSASSVQFPEVLYLEGGIKIGLFGLKMSLRSVNVIAHIFTKFIGFRHLDRELWKKLLKRGPIQLSTMIVLSIAYLQCPLKLHSEHVLRIIAVVDLPHDGHVSRV